MLRARPGSSERLVGLQIGQLDVPTRVPIGGCSEYFEDPLGSNERQDEVIFLGRHSAAGATVGGDEIGDRTTLVSDIAERPQARRQVVALQQEHIVRVAARQPAGADRSVQTEALRDHGQ